MADPTPVPLRLMALTDEDRAIMRAALASLRGYDGLELPPETDAQAVRLIERLT